jgi:hypothetical protein
MAGYWSIIIPETTTNLVTNPSIEDDTTGYTAVGGSAVRDSSVRRREVSSLRITPTAGVNDGVYYGTVSLTSGQSYAFSVDINGTERTANLIQSTLRTQEGRRKAHPLISTELGNGIARA